MHDQTTPRPGREEYTATCDVNTLNSLFRGEGAAVETNDRVIGRCDGTSEAIELHRIGDEHNGAAAVRRERIRHFGGEPAEDSGAWGTFTKAVAGTAKILGPVSALGALKQG